MMQLLPSHTALSPESSGDCGSESESESGNIRTRDRLGWRWVVGGLVYIGLLYCTSLQRYEVKVFGSVCRSQSPARDRCASRRLVRDFSAGSRPSASSTRRWQRHRSVLTSTSALNIFLLPVAVWRKKQCREEYFFTFYFVTFRVILHNSS